MNESQIRQQGFNDHADGCTRNCNPYSFLDDPLKFDLWEEGWEIREDNVDMFGEFCQEKEPELKTIRFFGSACPHCGKEIKVILK